MGILRFAVLLCAATPISAFAYVDPNTGGWLFQLLLPLLVAIVGTWGLVKRRITGFFRRWTGKSADVEISSGGDAGKSEGNKTND